MSRPRNLPPAMMAPSHSHPEGVPCFVGNETAIATIALPEGNFASIVTAQEGPTGGAAIIVVLDRDEVELHIRLLRQAMDDAERMDAGLPPLQGSKIN